MAAPGVEVRMSESNPPAPQGWLSVWGPHVAEAIAMLGAAALSLFGCFFDYFFVNEYFFGHGPREFGGTDLARNAMLASLAISCVAPLALLLLRWGRRRQRRIAASVWVVFLDLAGILMASA